MLQDFASFAALREKYVRVVLYDTNVPLCGITNINEYSEYIFSIFVYILDGIEDGALKEKRVLWIFSVGRIRDLFSDRLQFVGKENSPGRKSLSRKIAHWR